MPAGLIWQTSGPIEWLHLALHQLHVINKFTELLASLISKGRHRAIQLTGKEPAFLILPMLTREKLELLLINDINCQIALASYPGQIKFHLTAEKLLQFFANVPILSLSTLASQPIPSATNIFVDTNKTGHIAIYADLSPNPISHRFHYPTSSVQRAKLKAIHLALGLYHGPLNIFTDSQ